MTISQLHTNNAAALTPLGERLVGILQSSSNWMTRQDIAVELGRLSGQLTPYEWQALRELATDRLIQMSQRKVSAGKHEYIYKAN